MEVNKRIGHSKTIIHINVNNFYIQVELLKKPHLQREPFGVKQGSVLLTCNHMARKFGIKKSMLVSEALRLCPQLLLFNGEDSYKYIQASKEIYLLLLSFTDKIEKNGLNKNYLDVSELVRKREKESKQKCFQTIIGHCEGNLTQNCACGCHQRLMIGSQIAHEVRSSLMTKLGFSSCCGISYSEVLARISSSACRLNKQITLLPNGALEFLQNLTDIRNIPEIRKEVKQILKSMNVTAIKDLQEVDFKKIKQVLNIAECAFNKNNLRLGMCNFHMIQNKECISKSAGNDLREVSMERDVKGKFLILLQRLMLLVEEDGRMPMMVKVTVRKHCIERKSGHRETKQSPIPSSLFSYPLGKLTGDSAEKLLGIIMILFCQMVNLSQPCHITLLGLTFSKFHELNPHSIAVILFKKRDLTVELPTNLIFDEVLTGRTNLAVPICSDTRSDFDSNFEPLPKKTKLDVGKKSNLRRKTIDMYSPSKLKVQDLLLHENLNFSKELLNQTNPKYIEKKIKF